MIYLFQLHLLAEKMKYVKASDLEFFFNKEQGVIGIDGRVKENPKVKRSI